MGFGINRAYAAPQSALPDAYHGFITWDERAIKNISVFERELLDEYYIGVPHFDMHPVHYVMALSEHIIWSEITTAQLAQLIRRLEEKIATETNPQLIQVYEQDLEETRWEYYYYRNIVDRVDHVAAIINDLTIESRKSSADFAPPGKLQLRVFHRPVQDTLNFTILRVYCNEIKYYTDVKFKPSELIVLGQEQLPYTLLSFIPAT